MKTLVIATFLSSATILLTLFVARTLWLLHEGHRFHEQARLRVQWQLQYL
jgi:hypothetical protein